MLQRSSAAIDHNNNNSMSFSSALSVSSTGSVGGSVTSGGGPWERGSISSAIGEGNTGTNDSLIRGFGSVGNVSGISAASSSRDFGTSIHSSQSKPNTIVGNYVQPTPYEYMQPNQHKQQQQQHSQQPPEIRYFVSFISVVH